MCGECAVLFRITRKECSQEATFKGLRKRKLMLLQMRMRISVRCLNVRGVEYREQVRVDCGRRT